MHSKLHPGLLIFSSLSSQPEPPTAGGGPDRDHVGIGKQHDFQGATPDRGTLGR